MDEAFGEIAALAERINAEMTEIAYDLRPHQLDTIGLSKTIESMVRRVGRTCDIQLTTDIASIDDAIPEASQIHVFRIVQEAVSNIVKHSDASCAKVTITRACHIGRDHRCRTTAGVQLRGAGCCTVDRTWRRPCRDP